MGASSGQLTVARALQRVRDSETDDVDVAANATLERAISQIWQRLQAQPNTYIMNKEEFAVFNYFRGRFRDSEVARKAVGRFWDNHQGDASDIDGQESSDY